MFRKQLPNKFIIFASVVLVAIFAVENINHRFWLNDFKVYYGGVQAFINGTPVYGTLYSLGSGYYKYSPFTLLLVLPVCMLPYSIASVIQYFFLSVTIIALFIVSWQIITKYLFSEKIRKDNLFLAVTFICVINHLVRELHLGNINVVLLLLLCLSLLFQLESKPVLAGVLLAVVIITKPFFVLLLMPVILRKNYHLLFFFGASMFLFFLSPALIIGFTDNVELHKAWFHTLLEHNASFPSNNTIENLVKLYIHSNLPTAFQFYVMIAVCAAYFIFYLLNLSAENKLVPNNELKTKNLIVEWFVLTAAMPSVFRTDTQHFLLSLPLLMILLYYIWGAKNYFLTGGFILLVFLFGGNSSDMVGKVWAARLDEAGVLGISNLLIICCVIILQFSYFKKQEHVVAS